MNSCCAMQNPASGCPQSQRLQSVSTSAEPRSDPAHGQGIVRPVGQHIGRAVAARSGHRPVPPLYPSSGSQRRQVCSPASPPWAPLPRMPPCPDISSRQCLELAWFFPFADDPRLWPPDNEWKLGRHRAAPWPTKLCDGRPHVGSAGPALVLSASDRRKMSLLSVFCKKVGRSPHIWGGMLA